MGFEGSGMDDVFSTGFVAGDLGVVALADTVFAAADVFGSTTLVAAGFEVGIVLEAYRTNTRLSSALTGLLKGAVRAVVRHIAPDCGSRNRGIDDKEAIINDRDD